MIASERRPAVRRRRLPQSARGTAVSIGTARPLGPGIREGPPARRHPGERGVEGGVG